MEYVFLFSISFHLIYNISLSSALELNPDPEEVTKQLQTFLNTQTKPASCSWSEDQIKKICKSISKVKMKIWWSYSTFPAENFVYTPIADNSNATHTYKCMLKEFHYIMLVDEKETIKYERNGKQFERPKKEYTVMADQILMYSCPGYEMHFDGETDPRHQRSIPFKVAQAIRKNTAFIFQGTVNNRWHLRPTCYVTGLDYDE